VIPLERPLAALSFSDRDVGGVGVCGRVSAFFMFKAAEFATAPGLGIAYEIGKLVGLSPLVTFPDKFQSFNTRGFGGPGSHATTLTARLVRLQDRQFSVAQKSSKALVEGY
jgi:hypothetical protein